MMLPEWSGDQPFKPYPVVPMPRSIPKGLTREHVQGLTDLQAGAEHPFGAPTGYEVVNGVRKGMLIQLSYMDAQGSPVHLVDRAKALVVDLGRSEIARLR